VRKKNALTQREEIIDFVKTLSGNKKEVQRPRGKRGEESKLTRVGAGQPLC